MFRLTNHFIWSQTIEISIETCYIKYEKAIPIDGLPSNISKR